MFAKFAGSLLCSSMMKISNYNRSTWHHFNRMSWRISISPLNEHSEHIYIHGIVLWPLRHVSFLFWVSLPNLTVTVFLNFILLSLILIFRKELLFTPDYGVKTADWKTNTFIFLCLFFYLENIYASTFLIAL